MPAMKFIVIKSCATKEMTKSSNSKAKQELPDSIAKDYSRKKRKLGKRHLNHNLNRKSY